MRTSLASARKKHTRGHEHSESLKTKIAAFLNGEENRVMLRPDFDPETGDDLLRVHSLPTIPDPLDWALLLGDAIHNFRGALDHMACALADLGRGCDSHTQFPLGIVGSSSGLDALRPEHRTFLESGQPQDKQRIANHPYAWIKALSDQDKHHALVPLFFVGEGFGAEEPTIVKGSGVVDKWFVNDGEPLDVETEVVRWHVTPDVPGTKAKVRVGVYFFPTIGFLDRRDVSDCLDLIDDVVKGLLLRVGPLFPWE